MNAGGVVSRPAHEARHHDVGDGRLQHRHEIGLAATQERDTRALEAGFSLGTGASGQSLGLPGGPRMPVPA